MTQYQANGGTLGRIIWGHPGIEPSISSWWPSSEWPWQEVTNPKNGPNFPGSGSLTEFLRQCVRLVLEGNLTKRDIIRQTYY